MVLSTKSKGRDALGRTTYFDFTMVWLTILKTLPLWSNYTYSDNDAPWSQIFVSAVAVIISNHNKIIVVWFNAFYGMTVLNKIIFLSASWCTCSCPTPWCIIRFVFISRPSNVWLPFQAKNNITSAPASTAHSYLSLTPKSLRTYRKSSPTRQGREEWNS